LSRSIRFICFVALASAFAAHRTQAADSAQDYPSKPVTLVIAYPAGGSADIMARTVAERMSRGWGQPMVVEPRPGANGYIAAAAVKQAKPDGYTLLMASMFLVVGPLIDSNANFKPSDFAPVGLIGGQPNVFVIPSSLPIRTLKEFVEYAKRRPGQLNTAATGTGGSNHLGMEVFQQATGIELLKINYKGSPPVLPDLLRGELSIVLGPVSLYAQQVKAGKLRALAVDSLARTENLPDVPTVVEAGFDSNIIVLPWFGIVAPSGTPPEIVARLNGEINAALKAPEVLQRLKSDDWFTTPGSAADFAQLLRSEETRWAKLVKERNIRPE